MRDELHLMERTDQYLRGEMNVSDRAAFEERMRSNPELQQLVDDQRVLHGGLERLALRPEVTKAYRIYQLGKWAPGIGGAALVVALVAGGAWWWWPQPAEIVVQPSAVVIPTEEPTEGTPATPVEGAHVDAVAPKAKTVELAGPDSVIHTRAVVQVITQRVLQAGRADTLASAQGPVGKQTAIETVANAVPPNSTEVQVDNGVLTFRASEASSQPEYPGGFSAMHRFLQQNILYPDTVLSTLGVVTVGFLVDEQGRIREAEVVKGLAPVFDAEALRVVKLMPDWIPGRANGRPVKARIEVPIRFAATR